MKKKKKKNKKKNKKKGSNKKKKTGKEDEDLTDESVPQQRRERGDMRPVRLANDPGALRGARHRPRTSGGVTNRPSSRQATPPQSGRASPQKLPPLLEKESGSQGKERKIRSAKSGQKKKNKHNNNNKSSKNRAAVAGGNQGDLHGSDAARQKRCTRHFDKMRQFAYVRNSKITDMFMKYNTNGDDVIDYKEFLLMLNRMSMDKFLSPQEMRELFEYADPDGSGGIDINEFNEVFGAQEPLVRKAKKKSQLDENAKEFQRYAEEFATPQERQKAIAYVHARELPPT